MAASPNSPVSATLQHESWKRSFDASESTARWVYEPLEGNNHAASSVSTPMAFVSQLVSTPSHSDGRLVFRDVRDADAAVGSRGHMFSGDDLAVAAEFATLPLDDKYTWFRYNTTALLHESDDDDCQLTLRVTDPANVLVDSMEQLLGVAIEHLHRPLLVEIAGEVATDTADWLERVVEKLFDEFAGLFVPVSGDTTTPAWTINGNAPAGASFRAVGRLLGRVLLDGLSLKTHLARPLLKHLLAVPLSLEDVGALDQDAYATLVSIQQSKTNVEELGLRFCVGDHGRVIELKENGREIRVGDDNKLEYTQLRIQHILLDAFAEQLDDLMAGLFEVVPQELLLVFTPEELDRVLFEPPAFDDAEGNDFGLFNGDDPFDKFDPFGEEQEPTAGEEP